MKNSKYPKILLDYVYWCVWKHWIHHYWRYLPNMIFSLTDCTGTNCENYTVNRRWSLFGTATFSNAPMATRFRATILALWCLHPSSKFRKQGIHRISNQRKLYGFSKVPLTFHSPQCTGCTSDKSAVEVTQKYADCGDCCSQGCWSFFEPKTRKFEPTFVERSV